MKEYSDINKIEYIYIYTCNNFKLITIFLIHVIHVILICKFNNKITKKINNAEHIQFDLKINSKGSVIRNKMFRSVGSRRDD